MAPSGTIERLRTLTVAVGLTVALAAAAAGLGLGLARAGDAEGARRAPLAVGRAATTAPLGGVNVPGLDYGSSLAQADRTIALARGLHARVIRTEVPWSVLEPNGPEQFDSSALAFEDRLVSKAAAAGIKVIMLVDSSPCWASIAPTALLDQCTPGRSSRANGWPPRNPPDYAALVAYLARRYATALAAIEIWNEPDQANEQYFAGPSKPRRYAALLRAAYPAIKQANPQVPVLAGSLVGSNGVFLRRLYAAGIKGYYDGLAVHFYTLVLGSVRSIHEVQLAHSDSKPLWLDEFGWTSCWPQRTEQEQACVTPQAQAGNLTNAFRALARTSYVAAEVVYKLQDSPNEDFGSLTTGGAHKPSFAALSKVLASPFGSVSPIALTLRKRGGQVLASGSGPAGDYMGLEVLQQRVLRYRALFVLDRFNRYSITLPRALGTSGLRVRVFQYWAGSGNAAQRSI